MDYVYILHDLWEKLRYSLHAVREKPFPIWISEKMQAYMAVCFASVAYTEKNYIRVLRISWFRTLEMQYINIIHMHSMSKLCFTSLS